MNLQLRLLLSLVCILLINACTTYHSQQTHGSETASSPYILLSAQRPITRIAVFAIQQPNFPASKVQNLAVEDLSRKNYILAGRSDLNRVLVEQNIQQSYFMDQKNVIKLGNILNVDALFILEMTDLQFSTLDRKSIERMTVVGRLIDTQYGNIIWIKNVESRPFDFGGALLLAPRPDPTSRVIQELLTSFPPAHQSR